MEESEDGELLLKTEENAVGLLIRPNVEPEEEEEFP